jgi:ribonuclease BN (tRNA processing enzyme)
MKIRLVPSTFDGQQQLLTSYLVNDTLAVDAGALAVGLSHAEQLRLRSIIITHTHLDHVASLPLLITNLADELREPIKLFATRADFAALQRHIFNPRLWVELKVLQNGRAELLSFQPLAAGRSLMIEGLRVTPLAVRHNVNTLGLLIEDDTSAVFFTSDTGPTDEVWRTVNECPKLRAVFIDLSFPAALTDLARVTGHHSTTTLLLEIGKISPAALVYGVHLKVSHRGRIEAEVAALAHPRLAVAEVGREYEF